MSFRPVGPWRGPITGEAAAIAVGDGARLLLQLRDDRPDVAAPGQWGLFGGGIEPGETPLEAAAREFAEELGLPAGPLVPLVAIQTRTGARISIALRPAPILPEAIRLGEGAGFAFLTPAQCAGHPLIPALRPALADIFAALAGV